MYEYMEYVLNSFYKATGWNQDNIYSHIVETSESLIDFDVPRGFNATFSSQPTPTSCTSYTLSNQGIVNGAISYLYTTKPLVNIATSSEISLRDVIAGYRLLTPLKKPEDPMYWEVWKDGKRVDTRDMLLYGRIFLPTNVMEALMVRRFSPVSQLLVSSVSDSRIKNGGAITFNYQRNNGGWCNEYMYSTHESLLGFRGIYNFGAKERMADSSISSRLSVGGEIYYAILSKSPGLSTALRYTAQSAYTGTPLTMTLMCNPLMGHISAMYALTTGGSSFGSRFDFNAYSYVSELSIGCELWRSFEPKLEPSTFAKTENDKASESQPQPGVFEDHHEVEKEEEADPVFSTIKASTSLHARSLNLLWEGRFKDVLVSAGVGLSFAARTPECVKIGVSLQYNS